MAPVRMSFLSAVVVLASVQANAHDGYRHQDDDDLPGVALTTRSGEGGLSVLFTLYRNNVVVYRHDVPNGSQYLTVTITPVERDALLSGLAIDRIGELQGNEQGADGGADCIEVWSKRKRLTMSCAFGLHFPPGEQPRELWAIWRRLRAFDSARARPYLPDRVPLRLSAVPLSSACASGPSAAWPSDWPAPSPDNTVTLPGSALPALQRFWWLQPGHRCRTALVVNGRRYAISDYQVLSRLAERRLQPFLTPARLELRAVSAGAG